MLLVLNHEDSCIYACVLLSSDGMKCRLNSTITDIKIVGSNLPFMTLTQDNIIDEQKSEDECQVFPWWRKWRLKIIKFLLFFLLQSSLYLLTLIYCAPTRCCCLSNDRTLRSFVVDDWKKWKRRWVKLACRRFPWITSHYSYNVHAVTFAKGEDRLTFEDLSSCQKWQNKSS